MKRIFDLIVSFAGLVLLSPCFLIIILIIKFKDKGHIFFKQKRVGRNNKIFLLCKFQSMYPFQSSKEGDFEPGKISRVTRIGKFLRRTKLDELPQLFNVFVGDMSFVGPRPEVKKWTEVYPEKWAKVHSVKPGITDNTSIEFRNEEELLSQSQDPEETYRNVILPRKLDLYIDYVNNHTFFGDILIILRTIKAVLFR
jgi:lipopolysaccharide/colanic/teichoic acid biosynthesis glycosyltransferase